jgi:hypothetical protein
MEGITMNMLTILIILAMLATIGALVTGVISMGHGGTFDEKHSTQFMSARVILHVAAIVLILTSLFFAIS